MGNTGGGTRAPAPGAPVTEMGNDAPSIPVGIDIPPIAPTAPMACIACTFMVCIAFMFTL